MKANRSGKLAKEAAAPKAPTWKVPESAKVAANLLFERYQKDVNALGLQVVKELGLNPDEYDYTCDFNAGVVTRHGAAKKTEAGP